MYPIDRNISDTVSGIPARASIVKRPFLDSVNLTVCLTMQSEESNNGHTGVIRMDVAISDPGIAPLSRWIFHTHRQILSE